MKIIDCVQATPEWFLARRGKMTASHAQAIGSSGVGLDTYCHRIVAEMLTMITPAGHVSVDMERGKTLENEARGLYEIETGKTVSEVGFIIHNDFVGCSPDGLVDDGGIEIKCPNDMKYLNLLLYGKIEPEYCWQMQMNMLITGRSWWDYIAYNPNFNAKSIIIRRILADDVAQCKLLKGFEIGEAKIKELLKLAKEAGC